MSGSNSSPRAGAEPPAKPADEPLGLTVHGLPKPESALPAQRASGRLKMLMVLLVCAAPVLASYFTFYVVQPSGGGSAYADLIAPPVPMPALQARGLEGQPEALRALLGQWLLVVVDNAACGADCEKRLFTQRQLREMLGRERDRLDKLWIVLDDAPLSAALQEALVATPAMHILRLPQAEVAAWLRPEPGQALNAHLYVIDPMGRWMMRAPAQADPGKFKRDLDRLLRASASWDKPGRSELIDAAAASRADADASAQAASAAPLPASAVPR